MYNEIIIDHFSTPRNVGELEKFDFMLESGNPVCDDRMTFWFELNDEKNTIKKVGFKAFGCASSLATASIFSEFVTNKKIESINIDSQPAMMLGELEPNQQHCYDILRGLFEDIGVQLEAFTLVQI